MSLRSRLGIPSIRKFFYNHNVMDYEMFWAYNSRERVYLRVCEEQSEVYI